ncbi:MAG: zinc-finger domain-containing protein [Gammaproteobacteria bacterium]
MSVVAVHKEGNETPNAKKSYQVTAKDLPLHCPTDEMRQWDSHPRVYLPIEATGDAKCPYCGTDYKLTG